MLISLSAGKPEMVRTASSTHIHAARILQQIHAEEFCSMTKTGEKKESR